MQNKLIENLYKALLCGIHELPESQSKQDCLKHLQLSLDAAELADKDCCYNLPGKVVVRNQSGKVIGVQG